MIDENLNKKSGIFSVIDHTCGAPVLRYGQT